MIAGTSASPRRMGTILSGWRMYLPNRFVSLSAPGPPRCPRLPALPVPVEPAPQPRAGDGEPRRGRPEPLLPRWAGLPVHDRPLHECLDEDESDEVMNALSHRPRSPVRVL